MANSYASGEYVTMTGTFTVGGVATDPTTIALYVEDPNGVETVYTYALGQLTKSGTGVYYKSLQVITPGTWYYRFVTTGAVADTTIDYQFYVLATVFGT